MKIHFLGIVVISCCVAFVAWGPVARAQERHDIGELLSQLQAGGGDAVAKLLPSLQKTHPDKGGVLFLEAVLERDAERALALYQRIADEHAGSAWADDALYRLSQYSYAVGAYRTARSYTERLAKEYPKSPFLTRAQDGSVRSAAVREDHAGEAGDRRGQGNAAVRADGRESAAAGEKKSVKSVASPRSETYAVQVGAFKSKTEARALADELKGMGYTADLREKTVAGKSMFAVWIGVFADSTRAGNYARKLKQQQNIDGIVVRR